MTSFLGRGARLLSSRVPRRAWPPLVAVLLCGVVLAILQSLSRSLDFLAIRHALFVLPPHLLLGSLLATVASYAALVLREALALREAGARVGRGSLLAGAIGAVALGNAAGFGALTGAAVRYRVYGAEGVGATQVAHVTLLTNLGFTLAILGFGGAGALIAAPDLAALLGMRASLLMAGGGLLVALALAPLLWCGADRPALRFRRFAMARPGRASALLQIGVNAADLLMAGAALYVVQPAAGLGFPSFFAIYSCAILLGVVSHSPAGLGVFDAALLLALGGRVPAEDAVAGLIAYRVIYFLLPLALAAALLAVSEMRNFAAGAAVRRAGHRLAPVFLGVVAFAIGAMLVFSGATPAFGHRLASLRPVLPLWMLEGSTFLGSLVGVLLLFIARGLFLRLDGAWWMAFGLAVASIGFSLAKGLAFAEAAVLCAFLVLLLLARKQFDRPASLLRTDFTPGWLAGVGIVLAVAAWMLFFAFRAVPYNHGLWWEFAFDARAPRALRAMFGMTLLASSIALWNLLRLAPGRALRPTEGELAKAARIVREQERSDAWLAAMGDKSFLFSPSGRAFLMYAKRGRSWVALYDPVGPRGEWPELIARFVALAGTHGGRAAFYQVRPDSLPLYLDAGLRLFKLGEEARIELAAFGLEGARRAGLRYALKRGERDGMAFSLLAPEAVGHAMAELQRISDLWVTGRRAREKGFSVAGFDPVRLATRPVALVRQNGVPVAFAELMTTDLNREATIGVMRHLPEGADRAMDFLFTSLALHLKQSGFETLSLGMAPLAGVVPAPLAGFWPHLAYRLAEHGGRLYNFRGLRSFKNKFLPIWEPRYLAASGVVGPMVALADVAMLANGARA